MKTSAIIRIVIWALVACLLTGILCVGLAGGLEGFSFGFSDAYRYPHADRYLVGNGQTDDAIHTIDINWVSGTVQLLPADDAVLRWEETCSRSLEDKWRVHYLVENGVLHLQFRETSWLHIGSTPSKDLTVYIPAALTLKECDVENVSGEIRLTDLSPDKADLETVSGNITVQHMTCGKLDMTTVSGQVQAEQVTATTLDTESVSGDIQINGAIQRWDMESVSGNGSLSSAVRPQTVDTETVSGDITLTIPDNDGFLAKLDAPDNHFFCDFPVSSRGEDTWMYKNGGAEFSFDSVSGDITIRQADTAA